MDRNFAFTATLLSVNDKISINGICGETSSSSKGEERLDWREKGSLLGRNSISPYTHARVYFYEHDKRGFSPPSRRRMPGKWRKWKERETTSDHPCVCVCVDQTFLLLLFFFSFSRFRSKRRVVVLFLSLNLSYYFKFRLVFFAFEERRGSKERETGILPLFSSIHIKWTN